MTKLLEQAIEKVRRLPPERQDDLAESLLLAADVEKHEWAPEQLAMIDAGIAHADAGRFASDEDMSALRARYSSA